MHQRETRINKLRRSLNTNDSITFSEVLLKTSADELGERRTFLRKQYGFTIEEQRFIARRKPNFLLYDNDKDKGMKALGELLIDTMGFNRELIRTLVLRYPTLLNISRGQIEHFFLYMERSKKLDKQEAMQLVFQVPALLNISNIGAKAKEVDELFQIYHEIPSTEVTEVFKAFPYLYCCQTDKLRQFMAQFRKYRLSKEQILNLVSTLSQSKSKLICCFESRLVQEQRWLTRLQTIQLCGNFRLLQAPSRYQGKRDCLNHGLLPRACTAEQTRHDEQEV